MENWQEIIENMRAAGCPEAEITDFVNCYENGDRKKSMKIISSCRKNILEHIHEEQRKIDRLDYLEYQIRKNEIDS